MQQKRFKVSKVVLIFSSKLSPVSEVVLYMNCLLIKMTIMGISLLVTSVTLSALTVCNPAV
jgi:hypothetical protein